MNMKYLWTTVLIIALGSGGTALAQPDNIGLEVGAAAGAALGLNESTQNDLKPYGRLTLGTTWSQFFQTNLNVGYAQNGDGEFSVDLIPIDINIRFSPFTSETFKPFVYAGFGALHYDVTEIPASVYENEDVNGWTGIIPYGIGFQYYLSEVLSLDVTAGNNYSFSDELNPVINKNDDSFLTAALGIRYTVVLPNDDKDGDGLLRKEEKSLGTDPKNPDTDGDGLTDGDEVKTYLTDPLNADSDGDGLTDYEEIMTTKTDPNKKDTDGDGLTDYDELKTYNTNPLLTDSDGDGLSDYDEIMTYQTDPNDMDTDDDGLTDAQEINQYKTDPKMVDTDAGGINDFDEIQRGTNPLDAVDDFPKEEMIVIEETQPIVLEGVVFASGKAEIKPESEEILTKALNTLIAYPKITIRIEGYTDNTGSLALNMKLSQARAEAVKDWLVEHGIDPSRLEAVGLGPNNPIADNSTKEGRAKNRRIEFERTDTEP